MKAILMAVRPPYTDYQNSGAKTSEIRLRVPDLDEPFKVYTYETVTGGGCGEVVNEWVCRTVKKRKFPLAVVQERAKVEFGYLRDYTHYFSKPFYELFISELKVYKSPIPLDCFTRDGKPIVRPPQSWCYVDEIRPFAFARPGCHICENAATNENLTTENDFAAFGVDQYNGHRMMLRVGGGRPLSIEYDFWDELTKEWSTVGSYALGFCPNCGRRITEYRGDMNEANA